MQQHYKSIHAPVSEPRRPAMAEHHAKDRRGAELRTNVVNTPAAHFQRAFHQEGGRKGSKSRLEAAGQQQNYQGGKVCRMITDMFSLVWDTEIQPRGAGAGHKHLQRRRSRPHNATATAHYSRPPII
jgi:hypothetical protein